MFARVSIPAAAALLFAAAFAQQPPQRIPEGAIPLRVDGQQVLPGPLPAMVHLSRSAGEWKAVTSPAVGGKRHGLQGPIGDAFNSKFLAVYGEGDCDLAIAELDAIRNPPGRLSIQGEFPLKSASKVTAEDIRESNLILFGTSSSNAVLRRIAPSLPKDLMQEASRGGVVFVYPNPEAAGKYVVVWSGKLLAAADPALARGFLMPINALPDYVLLKDGRIESAGHFDNEWRLTR
jgi:hypothetical protein